MRLPIAAAIAASLVLAQVPRANAQAAIGVPVVETVIGVVIIGGILYEVYINSQGQEERRPATQPMMEDPEANEEEYPEPILADSELEARRKCASLAESYGVILVRVERRTSRGKTYECLFRPNN
jgi:hypothetical protein